MDSFVVVASASCFGFIIAVPLVLCFYPLIAFGDPYTWRKVYGKLTVGAGYQVSFLLNLEMLYWFATGWVMGWILDTISISL